MNSVPLLPSDLHNLEQLMQEFYHQVKLTNIYFKRLELHNVESVQILCNWLKCILISDTLAQLIEVKATSTVVSKLAEILYDNILEIHLSRSEKCTFRT